jgi:hypothetical protein
MVSNSKKIIFASIGLGVLLLGGAFLGYQNFSSFEKASLSDPLSQLLGEDLRAKDDNLKADFITQKIVPYDGPITSAMQQCMNNTPSDAKGKEVIAPYNINAKITMTPEQIVADIAPVFGHAAANKQINWKWDDTKKQYTFWGAPEDAKLWWCYLREDSQFFQEFLDTENILLPFESAVGFSFSPALNLSVKTELGSSISTLEAARDMTSPRFIPVEEGKKSSVVIGTVKIDTTEEFVLGVLKQDIVTNGITLSPDGVGMINLLPAPNASQTGISTASLSPSQSDIVSVKFVTALPEQEDPLLDILDEELLSNGVVSPASPEYDVVVTFSPSVGEGKKYSFFIDPKDLAEHMKKAFPEKYPLELNFLPKEKITSPIFEVTKLKQQCAAGNTPVCGKNKDPLVVALNGEKTYANICEMQEDNAILVKTGKCEDEEGLEDSEGSEEENDEEGASSGEEGEFQADENFVAEKQYFSLMTTHIKNSINNTSNRVYIAQWNFDEQKWEKGKEVGFFNGEFITAKYVQENPPSSEYNRVNNNPNAVPPEALADGVVVSDKNLFVVSAISDLKKFALLPEGSNKRQCYASNLSGGNINRDDNLWTCISLKPAFVDFLETL